MYPLISTLYANFLVSGSLYFSLYSLYSLANCWLSLFFIASRYSCVSKFSLSDWITSTAILEQWSDTLSRLLRISECANPSSIVHFPSLNLLICLALSSTVNVSISSSNGSTLSASLILLVLKESKDISTTSLTAEHNISNSVLA